MKKICKMKSVLISIRPEWVEKIVNGEKTIEVRKSAPKEVPFKAYIYCTKDKPYLYRVDDDNNFELTNTLRPKTYEYVKDYNEQNGKVIGEFICDKVDEYKFHKGATEFKSMGLSSSIYGFYLIFADDYDSICLSYDEVKDYGKGKTLYGWHISDLKIYDKPKELSEFTSPRVCGNYKDLPAYIHVGCNICEYSYTINCMIKCRIDGRKPLTRPPQSYMFVEEVEE